MPLPGAKCPGADAGVAVCREHPMKPKKLLSIVALGILSAAVLASVAGCAGLTNQPKRMPTPDELPQIYRNY